MNKIIALYEQGLYQEVIHSIDFNNFSAVGDPVVAKIVAASYFQLGQFSEALVQLKEIESCFATDSDYLSLYGACLRRCCDLEGARIQLELALKLSQTMPRFKITMQIFD